MVSNISELVVILFTLFSLDKLFSYVGHRKLTRTVCINGLLLQK